MILADFLEKPLGKGDASVNVSAITQALSIKYDLYSKTKGDKIKMKIFRQPLKDTYWVWLTMPTETERDNTYDVVYKFINPKPTNRVSISISKFDIQIFANTPSFAYTYSYVYNKNGLLIPSLQGKLGKTFMTSEPEVRNRNNILLFDKYIYFGARYILDSKVLNRAIADAKSNKYEEKLFNSNIRSLNTIMDEYKKAEDKLRVKKRKVKVNNKEKEKRSKDIGGVNRIGKISNSKNANKKSSVKKISSIKKR